MKQEEEKGITLIALVITIIVLLILAGVTLALVSGENGILKRATNAVEIDEKASAEEEANLVLADFVSEYYEEKYVNDKANLGAVDDYIKNQLEEAKTTEGGYQVQYDKEEEKIVISKNNNVILVGTITNGKLTPSDKNVGDIPIKPNPPETEKTLAEQITEENYGEKVNYSVTVNDVVLDNWKIFYKDREKNEVIIMLGGFLPNATNLALEKAELKQSGVYGVYASVRSDLITKLSTETNWEDLLTLELKNKKARATGGVDLETWVASWNNKYTNLYTAKTTASDGLEGYCIGIKENPTTYNYNLSSDVGYNDELYFPYHEIESNCVCYWLLSASAYATTHVMNIYNVGNVRYDKCSGLRCGIRPVIYLPADIVGEKVGDVWNIK